MDIVKIARKHLKQHPELKARLIEIVDKHDNNIEAGANPKEQFRLAKEAIITLVKGDKNG